MASEELRAVFSAVETISETLDKIGHSVSSLQTDFTQLDAAMSGNTAVSQAHETQLEGLGSTIDDVAGELDRASAALMQMTGAQQVNVASAATQTGAMEIAANAIDEAGDEAMTTAAQMGVLDTVMKELSLSGSALSVNIGAFNVSLRNLAPLVPIAASMGSVVTVAGAFVSAIGAATVALGAFTAGGAIAFMEDMQEQFDGLTNSAETLEAVMGGIRDLFAEAMEPLTTAADSQFFVNLVEGAADLLNRLAQAIDQMRGTFMPLFSGFADIINAEFDNVANGIEDMMETMGPILLETFAWFMQKLPDALRFMARVTQDLVGPIGNLGNSVLSLLTSIIESATAIFQGLAPAFAVALDLSTALIDVFNTLSNGVLQATLFVGGLILAANKFVGIANTMANFGITMAQQFRNFASAAGNLRGGLSLVGDAMANQNSHLVALGKVLTGNMALADASGQTHKDLADDIREAAEEVEDLENELSTLERQYARLTAVVEGRSLGEVMSDDMQDAADAAAEASDEVTRNTNKMVDGLDGVVDTGSGFADVDTGQFLSDDDVAKTAQFADINRELGTSFDQIGESVRNMPRSLAMEPEEVIGRDVFSGFSGRATDDVASLADDVDEAFDKEFARALDTGDKFEDVQFFPQAGMFADEMSDDMSELDEVATPAIDRIKSRFSGAGDAVSSVTDRIGGALRTGGRKFARFSNNVAARMNNVARSAFEAMDTAQLAVRESVAVMRQKWKSAGGATGILTNALDRSKNATNGLVESMKGAFVWMKNMGIAALGAAKRMLIQAGSAVKTAASNIFLAFAQGGVVAGFKAIGATAWGAVAALGGVIASALTTAVTFVAKLIPATLSVGTALNAAFVGIPALLGLIAIAAGAVVGILGNMDNITSSAKGAFDGLKNAISAIGNSLLKVGVPTWNLFVDILEAILAPVFAVIDGFKMIGRELGIISDEGGGLMGIVNSLFKGFDMLMAAVGGFMEFLQPIFSVIGTLIYQSLIIPFKIVAGTIHLVKAIVATLFQFLLDNVPFLQEFVDILVSGFNEFMNLVASIPQLFSSAFSMAADIVDDIMDFIMDMVEPVVDTINKVIEGSNKVLGTDFDKLTVEREGRDVSRSLAGAQTSAAEVRENVRSDAEEPGDDVATEPNVNLTLEDSVENNIDVDARPEDKAQFSRIAKDALEEANSFARRQQGGQ